MRKEQLAAQLYTVREQARTPAEISAALRRVKAIGYPAVQASGIGPIEEAELVRMLDDNGLTLCAAHEPGARILDDPLAVAQRLQRLGCRYTAYPFPHLPLDTAEEVRAYMRKLNEAGRVLAEQNRVLTYHNHQIEFRRIEGRTILEWIYDGTNPEWVRGEIDTYWVAYGGQDPARWCRRLKGRLPLLHLKDFMITPEKSIAMCEIGAGNLDWPGIVAAADEAGCEWFIVEQDTCPGDPFDSLRQSYEYLVQHVCFG